MCWYSYRESRSVPLETVDSAINTGREAAIEEGKLAPETFDESARSTPASSFESLLGDLTAAERSLQELNAVCDERFYHAQSPNLSPLREAIEDVRNLVHELLKSRRIYEPAEHSWTDVAPAASQADVFEGIFDPRFGAGVRRKTAR